MKRKAPKTDAKKLTVNRKDLVLNFPKGMKIAEIGVYRGGYAQTLVKCEPSELYLIDLWKKVTGDSVYATIDAYNKDDDKHEKNRLLVAKRMANFPAAQLIQSDSVSAAANFADKYLDAVYIDGDHSYNGCLNDLRAYAPKIAETGFMYGHDWTHTANWIEVQEAVDAFTKEAPEWKLTHITAEAPTGHPSWILTRATSTIIPILDGLAQAPKAVVVSA